MNVLLTVEPPETDLLEESIAANAWRRISPKMPTPTDHRTANIRRPRGLPARELLIPIMAVRVNADVCASFAACPPAPAPLQRSPYPITAALLVWSSFLMQHSGNWREKLLSTALLSPSSSPLPPPLPLSSARLLIGSERVLLFISHTFLLLLLLRITQSSIWTSNLSRS